MRLRERKTTGRGHSMLPRLTLLCASCSLCVGLAEVGVRLVIPQNLSGSWREVAPRGYMINKAGGGARHQFGSRIVKYRFNEAHQRGGPIPSTSFRVLCLGDSFTFGWLLQEEDTFVARLNRFSEDSGAPWAFLNGGAGGWGTAHYLAYYEDFAESLDERYVVAFLNFDDVRRSLDSKLYELSGPIAAIPTKTAPSPRADMAKHVANRIPGYQWLLENSHLVQIVRNVLVRFSANSNSFPSAAELDELAIAEGVRFGQSLFLRLDELCRQRGSRLLVVNNGFQPHVLREYLSSNPSPIDVEFLRQAGGFFQSCGIPYFDLTPRLNEMSGGDFQRITIPNDGHPNEEGARLIAEAAWPWLLTQIVDQM